jgi:hypothetical protein
MTAGCRCGLPARASLNDALRNRFDQLIGWAKAGEVIFDHERCSVMAAENIGTLRDDLIRAVLEELPHHVTTQDYR